MHILHVAIRKRETMVIRIYADGPSWSRQTLDIEIKVENVRQARARLATVERLLKGTGVQVNMEFIRVRSNSTIRRRE